MRYLYILLLVIVMAGCSNKEAGKDPFGLDLDEITLPTEPTTEEDNQKSIAFTAPQVWSATVVTIQGKAGDDNWITVKPTNGPQGPATIRITTEPNYVKEGREAVVKIRSGSQEASIIVKQPRQSVFRLLHKDRIINDTTGRGGIFAVGLVTNEPYRVIVPEPLQSWISPSSAPASPGVKDSVIDGLKVKYEWVFIAPNSVDYSWRNGVVAFETHDGDNVSVQIEQKAMKDIQVEHTSVSILAEKFSGQISLIFTNVPWEVFIPEKDRGWLRWIQSPSESKALASDRLYMEADANPTFDWRGSTIEIRAIGDTIRRSINIAQPPKEVIDLIGSETVIPSSGGIYEFELYTGYYRYDLEATYENAAAWKPLDAYEWITVKKTGQTAPYQDKWQLTFSPNPSEKRRIIWFHAVGYTWPGDYTRPSNDIRIIQEGTSSTR